MSTINQLHATFCHETGQTLRLGIGEFSRERCWYEFIKAGFTEDDLRCVIRHLRKGIISGDRRPGCLKFSNMIERLEYFEEELAAARAMQRNAKPTPSARDKAVQEFRRTPDPSPTGTARPVADYIAELRGSIQ